MTIVANQVRTQQAVNALILAHDILMYSVESSEQKFRLVTADPDSKGLPSIRKAIEDLDPTALSRLNGYN